VEKVQLNVRITAQTKDRLDHLAREHGWGLGDAVEAAVVALVQPVGHESVQAQLLARMTAMEQALQALVEMLTPSSGGAEAEAPVVPIATYEQIYGADYLTPAVEPPVLSEPPPPRRRGWLWRWLHAEEISL
jgi:hypothetical protein